MLRLLILLPALWMGISLMAQGVSFPMDDPAIRSRISHDVHVLASDSLEGRRSGTEGEKKASRYIIEKFREAGLKPMGNDSGSWLQSFPYQRSNRETRYKYNHLSVPGKEYLYYHDFGPTSLSADGTFTGTLFIFPAGSWNNLPAGDFEKTDLSGRFILYDLHGTHGLKNDTFRITKASIKMIAESYFAHGANGVIFWDSRDLYYPNLFDFNECDTLTRPVLFATSETGRRLKKEEEGTMVEATISKPSFVVDTFHNVIGYLNNNAPYTIILGAHYDHMGKSKKSGIRYGADDNASGTAMILELARNISRSIDKKFNYLFIVFSGEEEGLLGSEWFCSHPTVDMEKTSFMYNFDMVGRLGCQGNKITALGIASSPEWKKIYHGMSDHGFRVKLVKGANSYSDHFSFYQKNLPIAYLTTGLHYDYHTPSDMASKINYDGMVNIVRYSEEFITRAGNRGKIPFTKVSAWHQFFSNANLVIQDLDYILVVGLNNIYDD